MRDTALQTQDSKFEPWRSEAEHPTSLSWSLPAIYKIFTSERGKNILFPGTLYRSPILKFLYYRKIRLLDRVHIPVSTKRPFNVVTILGHCRSRCANVEQTFEECFVFAVLYAGPHISIPANTIY